MIIRMCFDLLPTSKENKAAFVKTQSITIPVYIYKSFAPWMIAIYIILLLGFFALSPALPARLIVIGIIFNIGLPVYVALSPKSIFSVRSRDDKKLTIGSKAIFWDEEIMPIKELHHLKLNIFPIDPLKEYEWGVNGPEAKTMECCDQYELNFSWHNKTFDFTFFLSDYDHYQILKIILTEWKLAGYSFEAEAIFDPQLENEIFEIN